MLLPLAQANVAFDEPATFDGSITVDGARAFVFSFEPGHATIEGSGETWKETFEQIETENGGYALKTEETEPNPMSERDRITLHRHATVEVTGAISFQGTASGELWYGKATCTDLTGRFSANPCEAISSAWIGTFVENVSLVGAASKSIWSNASFENQGSFQWSSTQVDALGPNVNLIQHELGHFDGTQHVEINIPRAFVWVEATALNVQGSIGLPNYNSDSESSPNLIAEGSFRLENLTFENGRFHADMSGDVEAARLDNDVVSADALGWATAGAVGTAAVAVVLWKLAGSGLIAGFTRLSMEEALEHPKRQHVFGYIVDHPGATFREVVRETGFATGTTRHHLTILKRSNAIMEQKHAQTLRYFENHGRYEQSWDTITLLREEPLAQLHGWLTKNPLCNQKAILAAMMEQGWSRSTTQHRLSRLVDGGLVSMRPQGRMNLYQAHPQVQRS